MKMLLIFIILIFLSKSLAIGTSDRKTNTLHKNLKKIEFDAENEILIISLAVENFKEYLIEKYNVDLIDTEQLFKQTVSSLKENDYYEMRRSDSTDFSMKYISFRIEYEFIKSISEKFDFNKFSNDKSIKKLISDLEKEGISKDYAIKLLSEVDELDFSPLHFYYRPNSIVEQIKSDITKVEEIDFKPIFEFSEKYRETLDKAEKEFHVNKEIIVGILKKETNLGRYKLKNEPFKVLLSQLLFSINNPYEYESSRIDQQNRINRLSNSAYNSLKNLIIYCFENDFHPSEIKSNRVGAIGHVQFMPFNLHLAKDGDSDGKADLNNMHDCIYSIANFLNHNGWKKIYDYKKDDEAIKRLIKRYNLSRSYVDGVYDIAKTIDEKTK
ncbi:MAG: lytic murein transglycosylase [Candidatus Delongbacteria bacterium]|nr:lytic murein transglycosylase [Candidatus Delongbacteria bacterium]MBN2833354.1 lytic murein transglycosylase [Candidatus Delongbacteria bacterium]